MQKSLLIQAITYDTRLSKKDVSAFLESFIKIITLSLKKDRPVNIIGFGSFRIVETIARKGRNPRTGKIIDIKSSKKIKFRVGKTLKDSIKKS